MFVELENRFEALHRKFRNGLEWINTNWSRPDICQHVQIFENKVLEPMDQAWLKLSESERKLFMECI